MRLPSLVRMLVPAGGSSTRTQFNCQSVSSALSSASTPVVTALAIDPKSAHIVSVPCSREKSLASELSNFRMGKLCVSVKPNSLAPSPAKERPLSVVAASVMVVCFVVVKGNFLAPP